MPEKKPRRGKRPLYIKLKFISIFSDSIKMNCVRALQTSLSATQLYVNHYTQKAKALFICMNASSGVTVDAQGNGRDDGNNNSDGKSQGGAMAGSLTTASVEGQDSQKTQIKRRKLDTTPDSPASKSVICKPIISGVAFRWHFLILVQAVKVN